MILLIIHEICVDVRLCEFVVINIFLKRILKFEKFNLR